MDAKGYKRPGGWRNPGDGGSRLSIERTGDPVRGFAFDHRLCHKAHRGVSAKTKPASVVDPETGEIFVPWGTIEEELGKLGLL